MRDWCPLVAWSEAALGSSLDRAREKLGPVPQGSGEGGLLSGCSAGDPSRQGLQASSEW